MFCAAIVTASGCSLKADPNIEQPLTTTSSVAINTTGTLTLPTPTELPDEPITIPLSAPTAPFVYKHLEEDDKGWSCLFASDAMGMLCEL